MKRYFYTDLFKAAWMCCNFNIKYNANGLLPFINDIFISRPSLYFDLIDYGDSMEIKFPNYNRKNIYIHPSCSISILPQVGDLITINDGQSASLITHVEFLEEIQRMLPQLECPPKIIQRQGKAWFKPEEEDI